MEQITIKLPPKMLEELKNLSEESYNPVSYYIRGGGGGFCRLFK